MTTNENPPVPAPAPCDSCPYRKDVPSGIWDEKEYLKLLEYDKPTHDQPMKIFMCHQQTGRLCAGWVAVHDMEESLAFRFASRDMPENIANAILDYKTSVPVFSSGKEAAEHGMKEIKTIGIPAIEKQIKIKRKVAKKG